MVASKVRRQRSKSLNLKEHSNEEETRRKERQVNKIREETFQNGEKLLLMLKLALAEASPGHGGSMDTV